YSATALFLTVIIPVGSALILKFIISCSIFNGDHLIYLLISFGLFTLQLAGYTAIITLIAIMTGDSGKTIIFSIALTLIMFVIDQIPMPDIISNLYDYSIFHQFGTVMDPEMTVGDIVTAASTGVTSTVVMLLIGMYVF